VNALSDVNGKSFLKESLYLRTMKFERDYIEKFSITARRNLILSHRGSDVNLVWKIH
jgi:hypothetical protein